MDLSIGAERSLLTSLRQVAEPVPSNDDGTLSPQELCEAMAKAATRNDLPVIFFLRLIWQESRLDPFAISPAGALGVAQFMPKVAQAIGLADPFDPEQALPASARFLRALHDRFGNLGLAAAAYNAGTRRIRDWLERRGRLPKETRDYVVKITGRSPEDWAKAALGEIELEMPPAPCRTPESLTVSAGAVPLPAQRPAAIADSDVSAAAKPAKRRPGKLRDDKADGKKASTTRRKGLATAKRGRHKHAASKR